VLPSNQCDLLFFKLRSSYREESRYGAGGGGRNGDSLGSKLHSITWDLSRLPVFEKNFYIEHPAVTRRPERDAEEWRREKEIKVMGRGIPKVVDELFI